MDEAPQDDAAALQVLRSARRELAVFSMHLQPPHFRDAVWLSALKAFLLAHERAHARIFVCNEGGASARASALVELGRRLPGRLELRTRAAEQDVGFDGEWVIADDHGLWSRRGADGAPERVHLRSPGEVRPTLHVFQRIWDAAEPAQELRGLHL